MKSRLLLDEDPCEYAGIRYSSSSAVQRANVHDLAHIAGDIRGFIPNVTIPRILTLDFLVIEKDGSLVAEYVISEERAKNVNFDEIEEMWKKFGPSILRFAFSVNGKWEFKICHGQGNYKPPDEEDGTCETSTE